MEVNRLIILLGICITAATATTCQPQIETCGTKANEEKTTGLSDCTVTNNLLDCLSLIPTAKCAPSDLSLLSTVFDEEKKDREKYCNDSTKATTDLTKTTTGRPPTTTEAIDCHTRAEICATEASEDSKKGLDLCTLYTNYVNCLSSISMTKCSDMNKAFILQTLDQQKQDQNKYCKHSVTTTTEAIDCLSRAEICATVASEDTKKGRLDLCTLYTNFVNCLSSISMTKCSDLHKRFVLETLDTQKHNQIEYCHYSTSGVIDCHTRAKICATQASEDSREGFDICTVYTKFVKCLLSISMTKCSDINRAFVLQSLDTQKQNQNRFCHSKQETSPFPTIKSKTTQFWSTESFQDNGTRTNTITLYGLILILLTTVIIF